MDMIAAPEVARRIDLYFQGGVIAPLTPDQRKHARKAVRISRRNPFDESKLTLHNARLALEGFLKNIPRHPFAFEGKGIVICGGGVRYFTNAWVCINMLRQLKCSLPIELWHLGAQEIDASMRALVEPLDVTCVDALEVAKNFPVRRLGGPMFQRQELYHNRLAGCISA